MSDPKKKKKSSKAEKRKMPKKTMALLVAALIIIYIAVVFYLIHVGVVMATTGKDVMDSLGLGAIHMVTMPLMMTPFPTTMFLIILGVTAFIGIIIMYNTVYMSKRRHDDLDNIAGDAEWMSEEELAEYNELRTEPKGKPYAKGRGNVIVSKDIFLAIDAWTKRNLNHLCIGGSGTGKTFQFVIPNILQRNCSMVITDPSGGLYKEYASYLEYYGYKVKCFNLDRTAKSCHYNPFKYIQTDKDIETLVTMIISNTTSPEAKGDEFWAKCETALFCAFIGYLHHYGDEKDKNFSGLKDMIRNADVDENNSSNQSMTDLLFEELKANPKTRDSFVMAQYKTFRLAAGKTLKSILVSAGVRLQAFDLPDIKHLTETDDINLDGIADEKTAIFIIIPTEDTSLNFIAGLMYSQLFTRLYRYCENEAEYGYFIKDSEGEIIKTFRAKNRGASKDAKNAAEEYKKIAATAAVKESKNIVIRGDVDENGEIKQSLNLWEIRADGGSGELLGFRGTKELAERALEDMRTGEIVPVSSLSNNGQRCPIHVRFLLDEFANTGKIPDFTQKISTIRKYAISTTIILQSITQLQELYDKQWETISANCDTTLYLGGGIDNTTTEWFNKVLGKETVRGMSESISKQNNSESYQMTGRDLQSQNALRTMSDEAIVIPRSSNPRKGPLFPTLEHEEWGLACSLPPYEFDHDKYRYIEGIKAYAAQEKSAPVPQKESAADRAYREEENEKAKQLAEDVNGNADIEEEKKLQEITVIDSLDNSPETANEVEELFTDGTGSEGEELDEEDMADYVEFDMDDGMSFSVAPMA